MKRIVAANHVILPDGKELSPGVVETDGTTVVRFYRLEQEQPFTEWLGGTIRIVEEKGVLSFELLRDAQF